jgi:hypothetical protein
MACRQVSIQQLVATAPATAQYQARAGEQAIVVNSHAGLIGVPDQTEERVTVTTLELADPLLRSMRRIAATLCRHSSVNVGSQSLWVVGRCDAAIGNSLLVWQLLRRVESGQTLRSEGKVPTVLFKRDKAPAL